jgi:FlaG/FlaF family flagellin (archaellin)
LIHLAKNLSNNKALSPVISTLIMINIIIAMFVLIFAWYVPSVSLTQSQANLWYGNQEDASRERIAIEMIYFNKTATGNTTDVYVRNVGEIDVKIAEIYVNATRQTSIQPALTDGYQIPVKAAGAQCIQKFSLSNWTYGKIYNVKVVTSRGSSATSSAQAPMNEGT